MLSDNWCCMNCTWKDMCMEENEELNLLGYCANYKAKGVSNEE